MADIGNIEHHKTQECHLKTCLDNGLSVRITVEFDTGSLPGFASVPKMTGTVLPTFMNAALLRKVTAGLPSSTRSEIESSVKTAFSAITANEKAKKRTRELNLDRKQAEAVLLEQAPPPSTRPRTSGLLSSVLSSVFSGSGSSSAE
jgi:hypothetical protein